jgi:hypothetical protein
VWCNPQASPLAGRADETAPAAEAALKATGMPDKIIGELLASLARTLALASSTTLALTLALILALALALALAL